MDYYNRLLRAVRDCKKLEYIDIVGEYIFEPGNESEEMMFRNKFIDAQLFRFRNAHIRINGIKMFAPSQNILDEVYFESSDEE